MSRTNCPNCGAPVRGAECEYCGTYFGVKTSYVKPEVHKPSVSLLEAMRRSSSTRPAITLESLDGIAGVHTWIAVMPPRDAHTGFVDHPS